MKEFKSFYNSIDDRKANTWCNYTKRLDTYGCGCQHDCSYCYSKSLLDFRGLWNASEPSGANLYKIQAKIKQHPRNEVLKLGGMTDCFQPLELKKEITYYTIKLLNYYKIHYLIVTKSHHVTNTKYLEIYDKNLAHFQVTITNTDDKKCLESEKASLTSKRIKSIEKLHKLGFDVSIRLSPFVEGNINFDILNSIKCDKILVEFLKVNHFIKKWFKIDYSDYMVKYGGYRHLPLYKKLILLKKINGFNQISVGEYVSDHHDYFKKNINYNKTDCCNLNYSKKVVPQYKQLALL
jgi:DNA repair photolyase